MPLQCNELQGLPEIVTQTKLELHVNLAYRTLDDEDATLNSLGQGGAEDSSSLKIALVLPRIHTWS